MPSDQSVRELEERIVQGTATCGVFGLGFIGSTLMRGLMAVGVEAHGFDIFPPAVERFQSSNSDLEGKAPWSASLDPAAAASADVVFVAVRLLVDDAGNVNEEPLVAVADVLKAHSVVPRLILLETTVTPGTTRRFSSLLQDCPGCYIAHTPERLSGGDDYDVLRALPHLVGGVDEDATRLAASMLSHICDTVVPVSSPEVSEMSKLLENAFLSVGIGLVGEVSSLAHKLGVSAAEICDAAATKTRGYFPFGPGAGVGGHCLPNDLKILSGASIAQGLQPAVTQGTTQVLSQQPSLSVDRLGALIGSLDGKRILLVGVGFKPGTADTTLSPATDVVRELRLRGALPLYLDALVNDWRVDEQPVGRLTAESLAESPIDAALIVSGDKTLPVAILQASTETILDVGGGKNLRGSLPRMFRL